MKKDLDAFLKQALTPTDEPDARLNEKILGQAKETKAMDMKQVRRIPAAVVAAAIVIGAGSVTAYASWKYLTPDRITKNLNDSKLTDAFQGKDAVSINETQTMAGYHVTLLGLVSGKDITQFERKSNGEILYDRTYCVTAIKKEDGTPMPDTSQDAYADLTFFVSTLIRGCDPWKYNVFTLCGAYSEFVENGVLYRLTECDNVEIFADHGLYLCVSDGWNYNRDAYHYDAQSGEITRNEDYDGLNVLFQLPVDVAKADPQAAAAYLKNLEDEAAETGQDTKEQPEHTAEDAAAEAWMDQITPENIDTYAVRVESTVQTKMPDEDGYVEYDYEITGRGSGSGTVLVSEYFKDHKPGMSELFSCSYSDDGLKGLVVQTYTLNEDGTVTFAAYIPKE